MDKNLIKSPTLLLDPKKCERNIKKMASKAKSHRLDFRPHFKTHQSAQIGEWIRAEGVNRCTVSSVKMAQYFADQGWDDILIAFPVNPLEHEAINNLAKKISLSVLIYSLEPLKMLEKKPDAKVGVKIELDLGSRRSGLLPDQYDEIDEILSYLQSSDKFHFNGFYSHPGHTYLARSAEEVRKIYGDFLSDLEVLETKYETVDGFSITIGDTPGCTIIEDFGPVREISPGNFVFYDVMQVNIGSCSYDDVAVVMACPVVGKNPERNELLIHGGAVHFSKEILIDCEGTSHFGKLAQITEKGWHGVVPGCRLKSISQEHGLVDATTHLLEKTSIGDVLYIYPAHSCLTANLMKSFLTTENEVLSGESAFMP